jgi:F-type H+-transporting ATPase subunit b
MSFISRKTGTRALLIMGTLIVFLLVCGQAYASGEGAPSEDHGAHDSAAVVSGGEEHAAGHGAHDSGKKMEDLLYRTINFALLVIILFVVVKKTSIKDFFANRREEIKNNFEELNKEKELAEKRYQELEQKLKEFESSKKEIIEQYKADGEVEKGKIIAEAEQRAEQILEQAELTIQREIQAAGDMLKQEVLDNAAIKAQEILVKEMKESDQDHLVDEFIKSVEKLH